MEHICTRLSLSLSARARARVCVCSLSHGRSDEKDAACADHDSSSVRVLVYDGRARRGWDLARVHVRHAVFGRATSYPRNLAVASPRRARLPNPRGFVSWCILLGRGAVSLGLIEASVRSNPWSEFTTRPPQAFAVFRKVLNGSADPHTAE